MSTSKIEDLPNEIDEEFNRVELLSLKNLSTTILNLEIPIEIRKEAFQMFYSRNNLEESIELIVKLTVMYELSGIKAIRNFLHWLCELELDPMFKCMVLTSIHAKNPDDEVVYKTIINFFSTPKDIATPFKISLIQILMAKEEYNKFALDFLLEIIDNIKLNCDYRYKTIQSLDKPFFAKDCLLRFFANEKNLLRYRILSAQNLLHNFKLEEKTFSEIEQSVLAIALSEANEYNLRADATDLLLGIATPVVREKAHKLIVSLGKMNGPVKSIYDDSQNVHNEKVDESVREILRVLDNNPILRQPNGMNVDVEYIFTQIEATMSTTAQEKVRIAFNRIKMDRARYGSSSLAHILVQIYSYIQSNKDKDEMMKRLIEELEDMYDTCSSGFVTRLVNSITGFGDFVIQISWRDQIYGNISGRLNVLIREMDDLTLQEKILEQMTLPTDEYRLRKNFIKFFRENILTIREDMYDDFKNYIPDTDFDLYFRSAVSMYETGSF